MSDSFLRLVRSLIQEDSAPDGAVPVIGEDRITAWSPTPAALLPEVLPIPGALLLYAGARTLAAGSAATHAGSLSVDGVVSSGGTPTLSNHLTTKGYVDSAVGSVDLSSRVPYTGANQAVNLGTQDLTAGAITANSVSISPSSGASSLRLNNYLGGARAFIESNNPDEIRLRNSTNTSNSAALLCGAITSGVAGTSNGQLVVGAATSVNAKIQIGGTANLVASGSCNALGTTWAIVTDTTGSGGPAALRFGSTGTIGFGDTAANLGTMDVVLGRSSANTLGVYTTEAKSTLANVSVAAITASGITVNNADASNTGIDVRPWITVKNNSAQLTGYVGAGQSIFTSGANGATDFGLRAVGTFGISAGNSTTPAFTIAGQTGASGTSIEASGRVTTTFNTALITQGQRWVGTDGTTYWHIGSQLQSGNSYVQLDAAMAGTGQGRLNLGAGYLYVEGGPTRTGIRTFGPLALQPAALGGSGGVDVTGAMTVSGNINVTSGSSIVGTSISTTGLLVTDATSASFVRSGTAYATQHVGGSDQGRYLLRGDLANSAFGWGSSVGASQVTTMTTGVFQDSSGILALRNGTNSQTFRIYNTFTSSTSFENAQHQWASNEYRTGVSIGSGGGTMRSMSLGSWNSAGTWRSAITITGSNSTEDTTLPNIAISKGNSISGALSINAIGGGSLSTGDTNSASPGVFFFGTTATTSPTSIAHRFAVDPVNNVVHVGGYRRAVAVDGLLTASYATGTDAAGSGLCIAGGRGTGTGAGGSIKFQTAPAGSTGSSLNSLVDRLEITSAGTIDFLGASVMRVSSLFGVHVGASSIHFSTNPVSAPDGRLVRSGTGQLDVQADNGLRIRNLANSAVGPLTAGVISATNVGAASGFRVSTSSMQGLMFPSGYTSLINYSGHTQFALGLTSTAPITSTVDLAFGANYYTPDVRISRVSSTTIGLYSDAGTTLAHLNCGGLSWTPTQSSLDPTTSNIPSGRRVSWYNSVSTEFRDWVNISGTLFKSRPYSSTDQTALAAAVYQSTETTNTPSGTTQTVTLNSNNHQTINLGSSSGDVTVTLTVPAGPCAGTLIVQQHASTARNITWAVSAGSIKWLGTQPTWNADATSSYRVVSWRYNGSIMFLMATDSGT